MRVYIFIAAIIASVSISVPAVAEVFVYKDAKGAILLTDRPQSSRKYTSVKSPSIKTKSTRKNFTATRKQSTTNSASRSMKHFTRYTSIIKRASSKYKLDHSLVSAVVQVESQFNPAALSKAGAIGLMQLMPTTAEQLGVVDPYDPSQNVEGGTKYLRYLIERFDGDVTLALAAYNSGPLNVEKYGKVPPFKETKRYIKKIYSIYKGTKNINLSSTGGSTIRRVTLDDGSVVYSNYLQNGSQKF